MRGTCREPCACPSRLYRQLPAPIVKKGYVMAKRVYVETTIPGYLAAWPSRDLRQAARQQITHDWWNNYRQNFDLCISETVLDEAAAGDADAARRRLVFLQGLPLLESDRCRDAVAEAIMASRLLPQKAGRDALHIAVSSVHGMDMLLTWNCQHIANATIMKELGEIIAQCGFDLPSFVRLKSYWEIDCMTDTDNKETRDEVASRGQEDQGGPGESMGFDIDGSWKTRGKGSKKGAERFFLRQSGKTPNGMAGGRERGTGPPGATCFASASVGLAGDGSRG